MDNATRKLIQEVTQSARKLLELEYREQLEGVYDILLDGSIAPQPGVHLDPRQRLIRQKLVGAINHKIEKGQKAGDAVAEYLREAAFTTLNRFVALKMLESRGLTQECVSRGEQSAGFREFSGLAPGLAPLPDHGYRIYLECLFDEIGREVPALFDRRDEASLLWPRRQALNELLDTLNAREIAGVWAEDETIGWVYQYFNSLEERRKMRDESTAPRNSYELAVRNQFFTPRYVIQFLTDNTLGRTWYEMRKGDTALSGRCQYLVRRPKEVFLSDPWKAAEFLWGSEDGQRRGVLPPSVAAAFKGQLSGIECDDGHLARWISLAIHPEQFAKITGEPYNSYDFSVLDQIWDSLEKDEDAPVLHDSLSIWMALCNFTINDGGGAYSIKPFRTLWELFLRAIQEEQEKMREASQAELANQPVYVPHRQKKDPRDLKVLDPACGSGHFLLYCFDLFQVIYEEAYGDEEIGPALRRDYPDFEQFRCSMPELILRHNLRGIDIDARCTQIAALALWMRAQRAYREMGLKLNERPAIKQINIVCAEPMPGEHDLLEEFIAALPDDVPGELVRGVFERMTLAGEAGSLLRIEDDIREPIARAKEEWERARGTKQPELFDKSALSSLFGRASINDQKFWDMAEERVHDALRDYARHASLNLTNGHSFQRRLFAEDALQGFDFIDLLRLRFDVVLMNPPFGNPSFSTRNYLSQAYPKLWADIYTAFIDRGGSLLSQSGRLGAITSRTFLALASFESLRKTLLEDVKLQALAECGLGVLDNATVRAAFFVAEKTKSSVDTITFWDLRRSDDRGGDLKKAINGLLPEITFPVSRAALGKLPGKPFAYWLPIRFIQLLENGPYIDSERISPETKPSRAKVAVGASTTDDNRFVRCHWEIPPQAIGPKGWARFAHAGGFCRFYSPTYAVLKWDAGGKQILSVIDEAGNIKPRLRCQEHFFNQGLVSPYISERSSSRFRKLGIRCMVSECRVTIRKNKRKSRLMR